MDEAKKPECVDLAMSELLTGYCFGDLNEEQQFAFEAHFLECDACWEEVQKLDRAVQALRALRKPHKLNGE